MQLRALVDAQAVKGAAALAAAVGLPTAALERSMVLGNPIAAQLSEPPPPPPTTTEPTSSVPSGASRGLW